MTSASFRTMPIYNCSTILDDNVDTSMYDGSTMGIMGSVPSPVFSQSSADSQESSNHSAASPMSMTFSPHNLQNLVYIGQESGENLGLPFLRIVEEPVEKFRFRYKSEMMGTHGSILGRNSDKLRKKSYPSVELCNYNGPAIIRCSLYTANADENIRTPHTHRLVVRVDNDDKDDPHEIIVSNEVGYTAVFQGMGIIHTAKKNITDELMKKKRARLLENLRTKAFKTSSLSTKEEINIRHEAEVEAKKMNLNSVTLYFEAFMTDSNGFLQPICQPIFSKAINNMKSALTGELKICRIDKYVSSCMGGEEVFILVEKVGKKNIKVKFFEMDDEDNEIWCDFGKFSELDVHHQYAIVFRTPQYRDVNIDKTVDVFLQLYRPTDGDCSEPIKFSYKPSEKLSNSRKRPRTSMADEVPVAVVHGQRNLSGLLPTTIEPAHNIVSNHIDPILPQDNDDSCDLLNILNENALNSSECKEYMKILSYPEDLWNHPRPVIPSYLPDMSKPGNGNISVDTTSGGIMFQCVNVNGMKMEGTGLEYMDLMDLTTDGAKVGQTKRFDSSKNSIDIDSVSTQLNNISIKDGIKKEPINPDEDIARKVVGKLMEMQQEKPPPHIVREKITESFSEKNEYGDSALHLAIINDQRDLLKQMLTILGRGQYSNIINALNNQTNTPLHCAVLENQWESVQLLLNVGADPNKVNSEGDTAIHLAVFLGYDRCLAELLEKNNYLMSNSKPQYNIRNYKGWTPVQLAAVSHNLTAIKRLVQAGADVNQLDSTHGRTVLHIAVEEGDRELTHFLLTQTNIDVNIANYSGNTALHVACVVGETGSPELCKLLLSYKADPYKTNNGPCPQEGTHDSPSFVEVKRETDSEEENSEEDLKGQSSFDLASNNKNVLNILQQKVDNCVEYKPVQRIVPKDEPSTNPVSGSTLTDGSGLFDEETLQQLCCILDESKGWVNLADLLDYSFLVPSISSATSPSKLLFNYANLHGSVTAQDIRHFLEALDKPQAVEAIDLMLAKQLTASS